MPFIKNLHLKLCVVTGLLWLNGLSPLHAQEPAFKFSDNRKRENIPFVMVKNLIIIPALINDKGPFNLVLDTGVSLFLITDTTLVNSLNIEILRSIKINGLGEGNEINAYVTPALKLELGHTIATRLPAGILKKDVFDLSAYAGMPIHGIIGYEFFNSFTVRINYRDNFITIFRSDTKYITRKGSKIPLTIEDRKPYLEAEIAIGTGEKETVKLIIDSGAGHPVSLETVNNLPFVVPPVNIKANLGIGLAGPINGHLARIHSLKIGKYRLKNVIAAFPEYNDAALKVINKSRNGNLGNAILKRFTATFDYHRKALYIKPNFKLNEPFEHDMSGMELSSGGESFQRLFISRIEPNSAAESCGLQKGDEILAINFKPVAKMSMNEIDELFHSRNDRIFILDVLPHDQKTADRVLITLQRRI